VRAKITSSKIHVRKNQTLKLSTAATQPTQKSKCLLKVVVREKNGKKTPQKLIFG
jgi:hypothetical protein